VSIYNPLTQDRSCGDDTNLVKYRQQTVVKYFEIGLCVKVGKPES